MRRSKLGVLGMAVVVAGTAFVFSATALGGENDSGFKTLQDPMLRPGTDQFLPGPAQAPQPGAPTDVTVEPLLTVGDTLPGGYTFEAIPDGISLWPRGQGRVDLFVNHETSTVPFPYIPGARDEAESQNDFDNSQVSLLSLNQHSAGVLQGKIVISSSEAFQRFCSNFLASSIHGFDRPIFFTNEEGIDWVSRSGQAWPPPVDTTPPTPAFEATDAAREIGLTVAYDVRNGKHKPILGMGRFNHENTVAVPGYGKPVLLSGDDTFVSLPPQSQLYMYKADSADDVWNDNGDLYAFVADTPTGLPIVDDYFDFVYGAPSGTPLSVTGNFVRVPDFADDPDLSIAHGLRADGKDVTSRDFSLANGYTPAYDPAPSSNWQTSPFTPTHGIDGPQWVLEQWGDRLKDESDNPKPVFQFIRVEDIAVDKRSDMWNVVYIVDSGAGSNGAPQAGRSTNGRIWRMELDKGNPLHVVSLRVLVDGDEDPTGRNTAALTPASPDSAERAFGEIRQPDNIDTTANGSLMVQEDPGSRQQFPAEVSADPFSIHPFRTTARLWQVDLPPPSYDPLTAPYDALDKRVVAVVDQDADEGATDRDPADVPATLTAPAFLVSPGNLGVWESSGVVDASSVFGPGAFLVTIQAHTLAIQWEAGLLDTVAGGFPDFHNKREGGQLILVRVPDA